METPKQVWHVLIYEELSNEWSDAVEVLLPMKEEVSPQELAEAVLRRVLHEDELMAERESHGEPILGGEITASITATNLNFIMLEIRDDRGHQMLITGARDPEEN